MKGRWTVSLEFKPQDLWVGIFWKHTTGMISRDRREWWICLIPCLPLHVTHYLPERKIGYRR